MPAPSASSADGIETLFVCANSKIFSFTTAGPARRLSPSRSGDAAHPIPWKTPTERTLAVGMPSHVSPGWNLSNLSQGLSVSTV